MEELREFKFFKNLDEKHYKLLSTFAVKKNFKKGSILFYEKDIPKSLTLLVNVEILNWKEF